MAKDDIIPRVATFEKVSFEQFKQDYEKTLVCGCEGHQPLEAAYEAIKLPTRSTSGSAGYDFYAPYTISLWPWKSCIMPTGIRVRMDKGWMLMIVPKSGLGTKQCLRIVNTAGIIDSDYYHGDNEGHIHAPMRRETHPSEVDPYYICMGQKFMQGIFVPFGITHEDKVGQRRTGGFGSTGMYQSLSKD